MITFDALHGLDLKQRGEVDEIEVDICIAEKHSSSTGPTKEDIVKLATLLKSLLVTVRNLADDHSMVARHVNNLAERASIILRRAPEAKVVHMKKRELHQDTENPFFMKLKTSNLNDVSSASTLNSCCQFYFKIQRYMCNWVCRYTLDTHICI